VVFVIVTGMCCALIVLRNVTIICCWCDIIVWKLTYYLVYDCVLCYHYSVVVLCCSLFNFDASCVVVVW
jgi:hypothetical protein